MNDGKDSDGNYVATFAGASQESRAWGVRQLAAQRKGMEQRPRTMDRPTRRREFWCGKSAGLLNAAGGGGTAPLSGQRL